MRQVKIGVLLIALVLVAVLGLGAWRGDLERARPIKIGAILPLTGESADIGEGLKKTLELALADLKGAEREYQLVFEDAGNFNSAKAVSAMNKLVGVDKVSGVITLSSGIGNAILPIADSNKVVTFVCASDPRIANGKFVFINATPPEEEVKTLISELNRRGHKRLGLFDMNQEGIAAIVGELKRQIQGTGIEIVSEQKFDPSTTDFRSMIVVSERAKPDIYLLNLLPPGLDNLAKQLRELKVQAPVTSVEMFEYTNQPKLFEGDWYIQAADGAAWFVQEYQEKFGQGYKICAPNLYDSFNFIVQALERKQGGEADELVGELLKIKNHSGALGVVNIEENHIVNSKAVVRTIKEGKPVTITL